jgi:hypothetical protein
MVDSINNPDVITRFEEFSLKAIERGYTILLSMNRFHPDHTAEFPSCVSEVEITFVRIVPRLKKSKSTNISAESLNEALDKAEKYLELESLHG